MRSSDVSTSVSGRATCTAAPGPYANVKTRRCVPSTVTSSQNAAPVLAGDGENVVADRELDAPASAVRAPFRPS